MIGKNFLTVMKNNLYLQIKIGSFYEVVFNTFIHFQFHDTFFRLKSFKIWRYFHFGPIHERTWEIEFIQLFTLGRKVEGHWFRTFFWGWDQSENTCQEHLQKIQLHNWFDPIFILFFSKLTTLGGGGSSRTPIAERSSSTLADITSVLLTGLIDTLIFRFEVSSSIRK